MQAKLRPETELLQLGGATVVDFWAWAYSDVLSNRNRSVFAEFLVGHALGVITRPRVEWDAADLTYRGSRIEVKTGAYVQAWPQTRPSRVSFDISKKRAWYAETNTYDRQLRRAADCFVFCVYVGQTRDPKAVLDTRQWQFYVSSTAQVEKLFGDQKTVALSRVAHYCAPLAYPNLRQALDDALGE